MGVKRSSTLALKTIVFISVFAIIAWFLVELKLWSYDFIHVFLKAGRWHEIIIVGIVVYILSEIITKLLLWFYRAQWRR